MNIKNIKKLCLIISIVSFAIGFSDLQENIFFWMGRPVGAIAFAVWMIFMALEKESALLDEQERTKFTTSKSRLSSKNSNQETGTPSLTKAASV